MESDGDNVHRDFFLLVTGPIFECDSFYLRPVSNRSTQSKSWTVIIVIQAKGTFQIHYTKHQVKMCTIRATLVWLAFSLHYVTALEEDTKSTRRHRQRSTLTTLMSSTWFWVSYGAIILAFIVYKINKSLKVTYQKHSHIHGHICEDSSCDNEVQYPLARKKEQEEELKSVTKKLTHLEHKMSQRLQELEQHLNSISGTVAQEVQAKKLREEIEEMQDYIQNTSSQKEQLRRTDLRLRRNRLNADLGI